MDTDNLSLDAYLNDLIRGTKNKKLKKILKAIQPPDVDTGYMDWNDREDFFENEYEDWLKNNIVELEKLV